MTTIAARINYPNQTIEIAADNKATSLNGMLLGTLDKLQVLHRCTIGYAGPLGNVQLYKSIFADQEIGKYLSEATSLSDYEATLTRLIREAYTAALESGMLNVSEDGVDFGCHLLIATPRAVHAVYSGLEVVFVEHFAAIGTGAQYALGAMQVGANPRAAVGAAAIFDAATNDQTTKLTITKENFTNV